MFLGDDFDNLQELCLDNNLMVQVSGEDVFVIILGWLFAIRVFICHLVSVKSVECLCFSL